MDKVSTKGIPMIARPIAVSAVTKRVFQVWLLSQSLSGPYFFSGLLLLALVLSGNKCATSFS